MIGRARFWRGVPMNARTVSDSLIALAVGCLLMGVVTARTGNAGAPFVVLSLAVSVACFFATAARRTPPPSTRAHSAIGLALLIPGLSAAGYFLWRAVGAGYDAPLFWVATGTACVAGAVSVSAAMLVTERFGK